MLVTPFGRCFLTNDPGLIGIQSEVLGFLIPSQLIGSDYSRHQPRGWGLLPFLEGRILRNSTDGKTQFYSLRSDF